MNDKPNETAEKPPQLSLQRRTDAITHTHCFASSTKFVLYRLADYQRDKPYCWPSIKTLASDCELNPKTVSRSVKELKAAGVLDVKRQMNRSNHYAVDFRKLEDMTIVAASGHNVLMSPPSVPTPHADIDDREDIQSPCGDIGSPREDIMRGHGDPGRGHEDTGGELTAFEFALKPQGSSRNCQKGQRPVPTSNNQPHVLVLDSLNSENVSIGESIESVLQSHIDPLSGNSVPVGMYSDNPVSVLQPIKGPAAPPTAEKTKHRIITAIHAGRLNDPMRHWMIFTFMIAKAFRLRRDTLSLTGNGPIIAEAWEITAKKRYFVCCIIGLRLLERKIRMAI
jgi:hypothetical protein